MFYFLLFAFLILWCRATYVKLEALRATKERKKRELSLLDPESIMSPEFKGDIYFELFPLEAMASAGNKQDKFLKKISKRDYGELIALQYQIKELDRKITNEDMSYSVSLIIIIGLAIFFCIYYFY